MKKTNPFYSSSAWAKIRADLISVRGNRCELCKSKGTQVHHITYARFGGKEEPEDLLFLCASCHQVQHGLIKSKTIKKISKRKQFLIDRKAAKKKRKTAQNVFVGGTPSDKYPKLSMEQIIEKSRSMDFK